MRQLACSSLLLVALALVAPECRADFADVTLDCYSTQTGVYPGIEFDTTDVGSGTETLSQGFVFPHDDDNEIWCQWAIPYNYDFNAASPPTIRLFGYSPDCVLCVPGVTCDQTRYVTFDISSRPYGNTDTMSAAWSTTDSATMSWTSTSCGSPCSSTCWQAYVMKSAYAEATPDAGDWDIDQLVYIRILRDTGVTGNLPAKFVLTGVRVQYTIR